MINIHVPKAIYRPGTHERLVTADVVCSDRHVCLFHADYPEATHQTNQLGIRLRGQRLHKARDALTDLLAQRLLLPTDMTDGEHLEIWDGDVFVGGAKTRRMPLQTKVTLTGATLFKDDYPQLECWIDYHVELGFERFILYYIGCVSKIAPEIISSGIANRTEILLVPWPYSYWVDDMEMGPEGLIAKFGDSAPLKVGQTDWHHAQQLMLNHSLTLLQGSTDFLGFFDLDEYFRPSHAKQSLLKFCQDHQQNIYIFQSRWSELHNDATPRFGDDRHFLRQHKVLAAPERVPFPARTKYIGRPEKILKTGAHVPKAIAAETKMTKFDSDAFGIYRFHSFSSQASTKNIITTGGEWMEIENFI